MRPALQELHKKIVNQNVFIIGGGPSAKDVDFSLLQNEFVVCINDAFYDFPNAIAIYWVDDGWGSENYDDLKNHICKLLFTSKLAQHISYDKNDDPKTILNATVLKRTGDMGYDSEPDCVRGNNSGVQILNLIVNMEPKNIILIGYDMKKRYDEIKGNEISHYHDKRRLPIGNYIYDDLFLPSMNSFAKEFFKSKNNNIKIINANEDSAINCFKFGNYKNYIQNK